MPKKRILITSDAYSGLIDWLIYDGEVKGMPAVYNLLMYIGESEDYHFNAFIINKYISKDIYFKNGSVLKLKKLVIYPHLLYRIYAYLLNFIYLRRQIKKNDYDLLYGMNYTLVTSYLGSRFKIKSVGRFFGSHIPELILSKKYLLIYTRYIFDFLSAKFPGDIWISTDDGTRYDILAKWANPKRDDLKMLYNGIDEKFKSSLLDLPIAKPCVSNHFRLCYIGLIKDWKRQDIAVRLLHELRSKNIDAKLSFIGKDGGSKHRIQKLINSMNLSDHVEFLGLIEQKRLPEVLSSFDACCFFYDRGNLGNATWEAALSGRLIITRDTGDTTKVFKNLDNAIVIDSNNLVSSAEIIKSIIHDPIKFNSLIYKSRKDINNLILNWTERIELELSYIFPNE